MTKDIFIWSIIQCISIPKIIFYRVFYGVHFSFGSIIWGFPKIRYGQQIQLWKWFQLGRLCRLAWNITIWKNFFMNEFWTISAGANNNGKISIGDNVLIGPFFYMVTWDHGFQKWENFNTSNSWKFADISIGNNVWIGARVTILKWVHIWDNVVIWAGSVVTKDIPSNSVAVGNPCRKIKEI